MVNSISTVFKFGLVEFCASSSPQFYKKENGTYTMHMGS
jgi:hypothetical protein